MIGAIIRIERKKRKLSQKELSEMLGVSANAVSLWETGKRTPGGEQVFALARVLGRAIITEGMKPSV